DDGSYCEKGFVTDILNKVLDNTEEKDFPKLIYACGPEIMLEKITQIAKSRGIRCQVSLEARMGCGVGACLVCACKTKKHNSLEHSHVCKDGPVFESEEVVFNG
ncbi:MAG: dihydroorotate dehydrogenase electron transfer subunit, partial [Oscillospiraceae bacterium]